MKRLLQLFVPIVACAGSPVNLRGNGNWRVTHKCIIYQFVVNETFIINTHTHHQHFEFCKNQKQTWKVAWGLKVTSLCARGLGSVQCGRCTRLEWVIPGPGLGGNFNFTVWVNVLSNGDNGRVEGWWNDSRPPRSIRSGAGVGGAGSKPPRMFNVCPLPRPSKAVVCSSTWPSPTPIAAFLVIW